MKGRIFLGLFALPFFGVGVWMAYSVGSTFYAAQEMKSWIATDATMIRGGYETHTGEDSNTYEAYGEYTYQFQGQAYRNDRVSLSGSSDNIGDFQTDLGNRLASAAASQQPVTVFVDPGNPHEAVVDRSVRWALVGFKSIFVFTFGGVGLGLLIYVIRARKERNPASPQFRDRQWLANDDWQTAEIRSGSKLTMYAAWGFAAFWNLISSPLPFVIYGEVTEKENYLALVGLLFPLVGIGLITWAIRRTLEWRRFGPAPVKLDPYPGSIGGHVGGTIDVRLPFDSDARFTVTLTNLYSYYSGTGKNRKRQESAKWQDTQIAHATSGMHGTRLSFRFDVPEELSESDATQNEDEYYLWRLNLHGDIAGVDIDRDYELPVYATGERSRAVSEIAVSQARSERDQLDDAAVREMVTLSGGTTGRSLLFPMGRNMLSGLIGFLCGGLFAGAGWYLMIEEGAVIFGGIFGAVGLLILLSSLYFVLNSLEVRQDGMYIRTVRSVLGIGVKRQQMRRDAFARFDKRSSKQSHAGGKTVMYYTIYALDRSGVRLVVGEGFKGASQAEAGMRLIARELGLRVREPETPAASRDEGYNFLAADT